MSSTQQRYDRNPEWEGRGVWTINGIACQLLKVQPARVLGESASYSFQFRPLPGDTLDAYLDRFEVVRGWLRNVSTVETKTTTGGVVRYREQHGDSSSLVVIEPATESVTGDGIWGVLTGGDEDLQSPRGNVCKLTLEVVYLAAREEFGSRRALERERRDDALSGF